MVTSYNILTTLIKLSAGQAHMKRFIVAISAIGPNCILTAIGSFCII